MLVTEFCVIRPVGISVYVDTKCIIHMLFCIETPGKKIVVTRAGVEERSICQFSRAREGNIERHASRSVQLDLLHRTGAVEA